MSKRRSNKFGAFTLIELMVVVAIIAILAALIIPSLQKAQTAAAARACMAKIRGFPAAFRAYAASWDGWTNTNQDYYIKQAGFELSTDLGFNTVTFARQGQSKDLICPLDGNAGTSKHGVRSSYKISGDFIGKNIMAMTGQANTILCGIEKPILHPIAGSLVSKLDKHYSYADGSASLGYSGPALPGVTMRGYNSSNRAAFQVPESELPSPDVETIITGGTHIMPNGGKDLITLAAQSDIAEWITKDADGDHTTRRANNNQHANLVKNFTLRIDSIVKFPAAGEWRVSSYHEMYDSSKHAISSAGGSEPSGAGDLGSFTSSGHHWQHSLDRGRQDNHGNSRIKKFTISDANLAYYKFAIVFSTPTGTSEFYLGRPQGIRWYLRNPADSNYSSVGARDDGEPIPLANMYRLP